MKKNGYLVNISDEKSYLNYLEHLIKNKISPQLISNGRDTAVANSYNKQKNQWVKFFRGIVQI